MGDKSKKSELCTKCGAMKKKHTKNCPYNMRNRKKRKDSALSDEEDIDAPQRVDFNKLDLTALKRYKRHYKLRTRYKGNKPELVTAVTKHFEGVASVDEQKVLDSFINNLIKQRNSSR
eukprot:TRINITY_DN7265_c0_g1_i1.p1 TRINITY_DN7265_c0_g1~~TRINITY_DN7265_c0_g1_i1.p1  ORF type:complete len:118 (-),score=20.59 TRINITY_DN7265_c0_g1_i1:101-454(-)